MGKPRNIGFIYRLLLWLITSVIKIGENVRKIINLLASPFVFLFNFFLKLFSKKKIEKRFEYKLIIYK